MKPANKNSPIKCPTCGSIAMMKPCYFCSGRTQMATFIKTKCVRCQGKGVVLYCSTYETRKAQQQAAAEQIERNKALKHNPFLPYYDKRFKK